MTYVLCIFVVIWWSSSAYQLRSCWRGGASSCLLLAPALPGPLLDFIEPLLLARLHGLLVNHLVRVRVRVRVRERVRVGVRVRVRIRVRVRVRVKVRGGLVDHLVRVRVRVRVRVTG